MSKSEEINQEVDVGQVLGAEPSTSVQQLTLYIPNKDKEGEELGNQRKWVLEAAQLLAEIGGGVSIFPPMEGGWINEDGEIIWENPVLIYTFINEGPFLSMLPELREFLHRMGRETNQGEVGLEFDGEFYRICNFIQK